MYLSRSPFSCSECCWSRPPRRVPVSHELEQELGGASTHATKSGVAHKTSPNDAACLEDIKKLLEYLPQNNRETAKKLPYELGDEIREQLRNIVPDNPNKPYDMHAVIEGIIDGESFYEIHKEYAENIIVGFARLVIESESQSLILNTSIISNFGRKVKNFFTLSCRFFYSFS